MLILYEILDQISEREKIREMWWKKLELYPGGRGGRRRHRWRPAAEEELEALRPPCHAKKNWELVGSRRWSRPPPPPPSLRPKCLKKKKTTTTERIQRLQLVDIPAAAMQRRRRNNSGLMLLLMRRIGGGEAHSAAFSSQDHKEIETKE